MVIDSYDQPQVEQQRVIYVAKTSERKRPIFLMLVIVVQVGFVVWFLMTRMQVADSAAKACQGLDAMSCSFAQAGADIGGALAQLRILVYWIVADFALRFGRNVYRFVRS